VAITELVVPRSIPIVRAIALYSSRRSRRFRVRPADPLSHPLPPLAV